MRCKLWELYDLRRNKWAPQRPAEVPGTTEVHQEVKQAGKEEQPKIRNETGQELQQRLWWKQEAAESRTRAPQLLGHKEPKAPTKEPRPGAREKPSVSSRRTRKPGMRLNVAAERRRRAGTAQNRRAERPRRPLVLQRLLPHRTRWRRRTVMRERSTRL